MRKNLKYAVALVAASIAILAAVAMAGPATAVEEWAGWRGPQQTGVSTASDLITSWSLDGEHLIWRHDFTGRSTPAVFDGRACANGRTGDGATKQEIVACWNAESGELLWQRTFNVYNTTVPFNRVGWGSVAGDPETGYLYVTNVDGQLVCFDRDGEIVWTRRTFEELGRFSGYGGRTHTPILDEDRMIISLIGKMWGKEAGPRHRFYAFDKRTGEVLWFTTVGTGVADFNTQSIPVITEVDGQRLVVGGGADGWIYALQSRTGKLVWQFHLSQRGINASVVADGATVYAAHSEENIDSAVMGRVVAIDATGSGDVTKTHERWRSDISSGFPTPLLHEGRLYVADNSANLHALEASSGKPLWEVNYGNVGKASPVWADGRIYINEVNGNVLIVEPPTEGGEAAEGTVVHEVHIEMPDGRYAEIYGSAAIAYGRIYFTTEEGIYALGDKSQPFPQLMQAATPAAQATANPTGKPTGGEGTLAQLQVVPAVQLLRSGESQDFEVRGYDAHGNYLGPVDDVTWTLESLQGAVDGDGTFSTDAATAGQTGQVVAKVGERAAKSWLRVFGPLPIEEDFEALEVGSVPEIWIGIAGRAAVAEIEDPAVTGKVLHMPRAPRGVPRSTPFLGPTDMSGYTVQVDFKGTQEGRRRPDAGVINGGYTLDLQGNHQRLEVRSWAAELRMMQRIDYAWDMDRWYTMKLRVDQAEGKAIIRGKVWPRDEAEPGDWTLVVEDTLPIETGSPGLYGYAPVDIYYDNVKVMVSE